MHQKTEFKITSYYHITIGAGILLLALWYLINYRVDLIFLVPSLAIAGLMIHWGNQLRKAHRGALLALIILNAIQAVSFDLGNFSYFVLYGPYIQIDIINWNFGLGFASEFAFAFKTGQYAAGTKVFYINIIQIALLIYLIDQRRFVPRKRH